jgi:peroxiredoxin
MWPRIFWVFLIALSFHPSLAASENQIDDLCKKMKIQQMKDKKKAPEFSLGGLSGRKGDLKEFRGKIVFLTFWATWCGPCREEFPTIEALWRQLKGRDFVVLSIAGDLEGAAPVEKFIGKNGYTFRVLLDPKGEALDLYRVDKIPMTFVIDKKGSIVGKALGPRNWACQEAISLFTQLIEAAEK